MLRKILNIIRENFKKLSLLLGIFLISLFSGTIAQPLFRNGFNAIGIVLWVIYAISLIAIFVTTFFLLSCSKSFKENNNIEKMVIFFLLLAISFTVYTIFFIVCRFVPALSIFNYVGLISILLALVSTSVLGITIFIKR